MAGGLVQLWQQLVAEARRCWEAGERLPHLPAADPDLRSVLVHQKLALLNRCIERSARATEEGAGGSGVAAPTTAAPAAAAPAAAPPQEVASEAAAEAVVVEKTAAELEEELEAELERELAIGEGEEEGEEVEAEEEAEEAEAEAEEEEFLDAQEAAEEEVQAASERLGEKHRLDGLSGLRSGLPLWAPHTQEAVPLRRDVHVAQRPAGTEPATLLVGACHHKASPRPHVTLRRRPFGTVL